uniref:SFRICE_014476 n=1 Tax=Spodoptera frugiperda TaxID=7108 RepID=A0A2H1W7Z7_SPOFR
MVRDEGDWDAVSSFCEAVMLAKEEAGRVTERTSSRPSRRERHSGRRGSRDDLRPPCLGRQPYYDHLLSSRVLGVFKTLVKLIVTRDRELT